MLDYVIGAHGHDSQSTQNSRIQIPDASLGRRCKVFTIQARGTIVPSTPLDSSPLQDKGTRVPARAVRRLSEKDIPAMLDLQAQDTSGFVVPRDAESLAEHFEKGGMAFGIYDGKGLAAGLLLEPGNIGMFNRAADTGYIGCFIAREDCKGQGLMAKLHKTCREWAQIRGLARLQADVNVANIAGNKSFAKNHFEKVGTRESIHSTPDNPYYVNEMVLKL